MNPKKNAKYYMIFSTATFGTLSLYFAPVIVTIACPFLFRERMTKRQVLCLVMSTLGVILIVGFSGFGQSGTDLIGGAMVLGFSLYNELGSGDSEHETV